MALIKSRFDNLEFAKQQLDSCSLAWVQLASGLCLGLVFEYITNRRNFTDSQ